MATAVLPCRINIDAERQPDGTWTLVHREGFDPENRQGFANTLALFAKLDLPGTKAEAEGEDGIKVTYRNIDTNRVGNTICGEFLGWSSMGQMRLVDLIFSVLAGASGVELDGDSSRTVAGHTGGDVR